MKRILVAIQTGQAEQARFRQIAEECQKECEFLFTTMEEATEKEIAEADFIVGNVSPQKIRASEKLQVLQLFSAGADPYLKPGILSEKTLLCNATGAYGQAVSEHAFALTMMLIKKLHLYRSSQMRSCWEDHGMVSSLSGATVLVVGLGDIGLSYARMVKAMGAKVIGVKRRSGDCPEYVDKLVLTTEIDAVLPEADVILSVLPSTKETAYFYTEERFAKMKKTAMFVNCGRGNAVSSDTLLRALQSGQIKAAAIDVCEMEPLPPDSPLWGEENLVITSHVAGNFHLDSIYRGVIEIACENLKHWLTGEDLLNVVDPTTGYKR